MTQLEMAHAQIEQQARDLQLYRATVQVLQERNKELEESNQMLNVALAAYQVRGDED